MGEGAEAGFGVSCEQRVKVDEGIKRGVVSGGGGAPRRCSPLPPHPIVRQNTHLNAARSTELLCLNSFVAAPRRFFAATDRSLAALIDSMFDWDNRTASDPKFSLQYDRGDLAPGLGGSSWFTLILAARF